MGKKEEEPTLTKEEAELLQQTMPRPLLYRRFVPVKKPDIMTLTQPGFRANRLQEAKKKAKEQTKNATVVVESNWIDDEAPSKNLSLMEQKKVNLEGIYSVKERESDIQKMKTYFETTMNPMQRLAAQPDGARLIRSFVLNPQSIHQT